VEYFWEGTDNGNVFSKITAEHNPRNVCSSQQNKIREMSVHHNTETNNNTNVTAAALSFLLPILRHNFFFGGGLIKKQK
jgi:hypothetical protein